MIRRGEGVTEKRPAPATLGLTRFRIVAIPNQRKDYMRYAAHCLDMVPAATDQDARAIMREMAAEWLRLADSVRLRPRFRQMQME